jgi:hypothetical protein
MKTNMTYSEAWDHIHENILTEAQREYLASSARDGREGVIMAMAAERLSEASVAAHGKGGGPERQLFERLLDENPL